jgi:mannose-6-phosphate isomerase
LFSSEALSVQVHPDDDQARERGLPRGKSECWFVLDAEPGAVIGLGLRRKVSPDEARRAALDGSIEQLIDWRPVAAGDFFLVPPGTIHAIGAGLSVLELQQNSDVTYRLYDYGRPRELHLDDGIAVAHCGPYPDQLFRKVDPAVDAILAAGPHFTLLHTRADALQNHHRWILPIDGYAAFGDEIAHAGECLLLCARQRLDRVEGRLLIGTAGTAAAKDLQRAA